MKPKTERKPRYLGPLKMVAAPASRLVTKNKRRSGWYAIHTRAKVFTALYFKGNFNATPNWHIPLDMNGEVMGYPEGKEPASWLTVGKYYFDTFPGEATYIWLGPNNDDDKQPQVSS